MESLFKGSTNDEKRKLYGKATKFVELTSKYIYNGYTKIVLPFATVPYLFKSYFTYLTTSSGKAAFVLPFVIW